MATGYTRESFYWLCFRVLEKNAADLGKFDKVQSVMDRRLKTRVSVTAKLVGCSRAAMVSTYHSGRTTVKPLVEAEASMPQQRILTSEAFPLGEAKKAATCG